MGTLSSQLRVDLSATATPPLTPSSPEFFVSIPNCARYPVLSAARRSDGLTDNFSQRVSPATGKEYSRGKHGGCDLKPSTPGKVGEYVFPSWNGTVVFAVKRYPYWGGWGRALGKHILVAHSHTHSDGRRHVWYSLYCHLDTVRVSKGQRVDVAHAIGTLGKTGSTTAPHVHYELHTVNSFTTGLLDPHDRLRYAKLRDARR